MTVQCVNTFVVACVQHALVATVTLGCSTPYSPSQITDHRSQIVGLQTVQSVPLFFEKAGPVLERGEPLDELLERDLAVVVGVQERQRGVDVAVNGVAVRYQVCMPVGV